MAELDPRNPLSAIGLSNNPVGKESALSSIENKNRMQSALAQIASRGQNADRLAGIRNSGALDRVLAPLGATQASQGTVLPRIASDISQGRQSTSFGQRAQGLEHLANLGIYPERQATIDETSALDNLTRLGPMLGVLKSQRQGADAAQVKGEIENTGKKEKFTLGGSTIGGVKETDTNRSKLEGKQKGGAGSDTAKTAQQIINRAEAHFGQKVIGIEPIPGTNKGKIVLADGSIREAKIK
jgi:hypothetical protein